IALCCCINGVSDTVVLDICWRRAVGRCNKYKCFALTSNGIMKSVNYFCAMRKRSMQLSGILIATEEQVICH
ncbi:MAG TPA: hypothetical protein VLL94_02795, partial [Nitrospiraceae bacterium]|nr:hypothetical protein [Nitrospiraceae bacterium]